MQSELLLAFTGVLSIVVGVVLFARPELSILGIVLLIGVYAILFGILLIILAFCLGDLLKSLESGV